jgi:DnaJ-class molecular chaperone
MTRHTCTRCQGSGEGWHDDLRCMKCRGTGVELDDDEEREVMPRLKDEEGCG